MRTQALTSRHGFSLIELVMVVSVMSIIMAIAAPRFADAGTGRRLQAASRVIEKDIELIKLRAQATGKMHTIVFDTTNERYVVVEGTDVRKDAVVLVRELDEEPYSLEISRTDIGGDQMVVVSVFGELDQGFTVRIMDSGIERDVLFVADGFTQPTVTETEKSDTFVLTDVSIRGLADSFSLSK